MTSHSMAEDPNDVSNSLDFILDEISDRLGRGQQVDFQQYCDQYPEYAQQIREIEPTLLAMASLGYASNESEDDVMSAPRSLGDYRIIRELGRGGMGVVYEAEQQSLGRHVALKVLPFAALLDRRQQERFKNEARAAAMLKHPHIVSVHSVGCERGVHYYAMELVDGQCLAAVVRSFRSRDDESDDRRFEAAVDGRARDAFQQSGDGRSLQTEQSETGRSDRATKPVDLLSTKRQADPKAFYRSIATLGAQAADALHYAHQEGVIHRDIKPSNLLLDSEGQLWVTDFGLARIQTGDELTRTGDLIGTLRYMSPEQLKGNSVVDQRTDIYSLGLTLYELIGGRPAFVAHDRAELIRAKLDQDLRPLSRSGRAVPLDLEKIVLKATAKEPSSRYQSARALGDDLRRYLQHRPVHARRVGSFERAYRWCARNRAKAALLAIVTTTVVTLAIGGPWVAVQQAKLAEERRHHLYDADMYRAYQHVLHGEIEEAVRLLCRYRPDNEGDTDFRNFEWYFLLDQCKRRLSAESLDHVFPIRACEYAPGGRFLAWGAYQGLVQVVDVKTRNEVWRANKADKHNHEIISLAFTADGRLCASSSRDRTVKVWDAKTGDCLLTEPFEHPWIILAVTTQDTQDLVAIAAQPVESWTSFPSDTTPEIKLYHLETTDGAGRPSVEFAEVNTLRGSIGSLTSMQFSPDGRWLATGNDRGNVDLWDMQTLDCERSLNGHEGPVLHIEFSADGQHLCSTGGIFKDKWNSGSAALWDLKTGEKRSFVTHAAQVTSAAFVPGNRLVTGGHEGRVKVWNTHDGSLIEEINASSAPIDDVAVSPDGQWIVSCGDDNHLRFWDMPDKARKTVLRQEGMVSIVDLAFTPDGKRVACTSDDGKVRIWNCDDGTLVDTLGEHDPYCVAVAYSDDGELIAALTTPFPTKPDSPPAKVRVWNTHTRELLCQHEVELADNSPGRSLKFAPKRRDIAIAAGDRIVLWDPDQRTVINELPVEDRGGSFHVVFSGNGEYLGCCSPGTDGGCSIWEYPSLKPVQQQTASRVWAFDLNHSGKTYAVADNSTGDNSVSIRRTSDKRLVHSLAGHTDYVVCLEFSPDDKRLVSASKDGTVILWNLETGNQIIRFREHDNIVWVARFSPDGQMIASGQRTAQARAPVAVRHALPVADADMLMRRIND